MCGITGMVGTAPVNTRIYDALTVLQHRGQDAAGIATTAGDRIFLRKDNGLVKDVFRTRHMRDLLLGNMGIGHVRYPTAGTSSVNEAQPLYVNSPYGIALAHNGNLTNAAALKKELFEADRRHLNTRSDSEILLNVFAHELSGVTELTLRPEHIFEAIRGVHRRCRGAYAVVAMIPGCGLVAFRDPMGIRPLAYGSQETDGGIEYMVSSESVALNSLGFQLIGDVAPGEAVFITVDGAVHTRQCAENPKHRPCIFEMVYFARPDSMIDGISVYKSRLRMGDRLAAKILRERPDHDIDVVIPVPDTSRTAAIQLAYHLDAKYREGLIKNRYIGRTFIMPGQQMRKKSVRQKLNATDLEFRGKVVLLVDDSIVRGTTSGEIIKMAREAGAKKVYFASAAPPVRYPNVYGIDMPTADELIAHGRTVEEIQSEIGADWLVYQDLDDLIAAARGGNEDIQAFEDSVFSGKYVTGDVDAAYLETLETLRSDAAKEASALPAED